MFEIFHHRLLILNTLHLPSSIFFRQIGHSLTFFKNEITIIPLNVIYYLTF